MSIGTDHHSHIVRIAGTDRLLVALDFDGTLAPLVDEPMTARMTVRVGEDAKEIEEVRYI